MKLQKLVTLVAAVLFLAVSSMAFANVQISVGSNSQPIPYAADPNNCNKGGDLSFSYQPGALIENGDAFTMDLDFGTSLCKDVDLWYRLDPADIDWNSPIVDSVNVASLTNIMYIHVKGTSGQRRVNVSFHGEWDGVSAEIGAVLTVGGAQGDMFRFRVFNQQEDPAVLRIGPSSLMGGNRMDETEWGNLDAATIPDNTLCVQHTPAQIAENEKINFNLNRAGVSPNVFEFIGGQGAEPQVGHFISRNYALVSCDKVGEGRIECGSYGQDSSSCSYFDYETPAGYCSGFSGNKVIVEADPTFDAAGDYYFDIKIKVNGNYADSGVYFAGPDFGVTQTVGTVVGLTRTAVCAASGSNAIATGAGNPYTWYRYGEETGVTTIPSAIGTNDCITDPAQRVVRMTTPWSGLGLSGTERFMWIDLPDFRYDLTRINAGDVVSVEIELRRTPCVLVATFEKTIGTLCCEATPETQATELIYPYFTQMAGDNWWDGIVVTNLSSTAGTAALSFYEQDGDRGTYTTPSIAAYSMYVSTLENLLPMITPAVGNAGALGNARVWIKANTNFSADGFAMIAEPTSGQSMGYLPRKGSLQ